VAATPSPYDKKPGPSHEFQKTFPFVSNKTGAAVGASLGATALGIGGGIYTIGKKVSARRSAAAGAAPKRKLLISPTDVVRNSATRGPKKVVYGPPRNPVRAPRPAAADSPMASVNRAMNVSDKTRANVRQFAKDLHSIYQIPPNGLNDIGSHDWENREMIRNFDKLPYRGSVPGNKATTSPSPAAVSKRSSNYRGRHIVSSSSYPQGLATRTSSGAAYDPYGSLTASEKGALRRKTNKAAAAAKPIIQQGLRARFGGDQPAPPKPKAPKKPSGTKTPAPTTVEIVPQEPPKPTTPKPSGGGKGKGKSTPTTSATFERTYQPGRLPGETKKEASARHKAETAADRAAERAAKKGEPKNTMKAPTSAKPPAPPKAETPAPLSTGDGPEPPAKMVYDNFGQRFADVRNNEIASMTRQEKTAVRKASNKAAWAARPVQRRGLKARYGAGAQSMTPERVVAPPTKPNNGMTAAERKSAKEAKRAENRAKHAADQAARAAERKAGKAAGSGFAPTPNPPSKVGTAAGGGFAPTPQPPPKAGTAAGGGFVSRYIPKPASDVMTRYGGTGRTTRGTLRTETTPHGLKHEMRVRTHRYGPVSPGRLKQDPTLVGKPKLTPIAESTTSMFPGTPSKPATQQPHMQGRGAKVIGEQGNFRVWQGKNRGDIVIQHRSGRQYNLPYNPNKQGPVNVKGILDYAGKGNNEKAFLKGGWTADGRSVSGKVGTRSRAGRFLIGAATKGGVLSLGGAALYGIGKLLGPAGSLLGPQEAAAAPTIPGRSYANRAANEPNRAARHRLQREAVTADRYRAGIARPFIEPSQYRRIVKKYGPSPFGNYADVVNTSGAFANRYPNKRYGGKK